MKNFYINRRLFVTASSLSFAALHSNSYGELANLLTETPSGTEGPFYPDKLPLDTDNDLIIVNDKLTSAVGHISHISGKVLTTSGSPLKNTLIEMWQVDNNGIYRHTKDPNMKDLDSNFQSYGRFLTNHKGEYYFRTIKPVTYTTGIFRTPHIHFKVTRKNKHLLTTQMYIKGEKLNVKDRIYNSIKSDKQKENVTREFRPIPNSKLAQSTVNFDIVIGHSPKDI
ncbi:MAG: protocatechuate 3,4-dioxygenase [Lentisphaeraceae bacterium]|nr:protocatechuate 3,4-dioxygenase [Lentisphaeraceae bacterium]